MAPDPVLHLPSVYFPESWRVWPGAAKNYRKFVSSFKPLAARALLMSGADDTLILHKLPDERYLEILRACGAGGATRLVPSHRSGSCLAEDIMQSQRIMEYIRAWRGHVEPYMVTRMEEQLAQSAGLAPFSAAPGVVELLNDKVFFQRLLEDLDLPRVETVTGNSDAVAARLRRWDRGGAIVRGAKGVGGSRTYVADSREKLGALADAIERKGKGGLYLLAPLLDIKASPNLQFYIDDAGITLFGETVQIMDKGFGHTGNLFDAVDEEDIRMTLRGQGTALAREAAGLDYRGVVGIDFIVTAEGRVHAVEMNARHNTSTHAIWFLNRLVTGDPMLMAESGLGGFVRFKSAKSLSAMEWIALLGDDAFNTSSKVGVLPYDTGTEELSALIMGRDTEDRERMVNKAREVSGDC
ncbi:MAG: hypothetical protein HZB29_11115 [Nitrospinae bacterium]|nr:hypothetical protein [Nitrospinota bacterium]